MELKEILKKINSFAKRNKEIISLLVMITAIFVVILGFYELKEISSQNELYHQQLNLTQKELEFTKQMLDFQYKPQILIELMSTRKNSWFTPNGYEEPNFIQIYDNDFSKTQTSLGNFEYTGEFSIPLWIKFYNFGSVGTKIEKIESSNSCNVQDKRSWQMDVMDTRIIQPKEMIEYNMFYISESFDKKPTNYTFCNYSITYTFFNGFQINQSYILHYNPFNWSSRDLEVQAYYEFIEQRKILREQK